MDYENTGTSGFIGCEKLKKCDHIYIFYTENAGKINLDILSDHGKSKMTALKIPVRKQSVDMHLVSYLGYLIGKNKGKDCRYIIISRDNDYDNIIKFWKKNKIKITRKKYISYDPNKKPSENTELNKLYDELIIITANEKDADGIINIINRCTSKTAVNNSLMNHFKDGKKVSEIYAVIKPYIQDKD